MKVLLIDDEVNLANATAAGLKAEGIDCAVATDALVGFELARDGQFDAILLDIMMPEMNGFLVCRHLRDAGVRTPIIVLTAKDGEFDQQEALETGADDFQTKPVSMTVLAARLNAVARRAEWSQPSGNLSIGDLKIESLRSAAIRDGKEISLTNREYSLLVALAKASPQPVTKEELLRIVWGDEFTGNKNVVEVYIGYLRKKIDVPPHPELIKTVRGTGYRLGPA